MDDVLPGALVLFPESEEVLPELLELPDELDDPEDESDEESDVDVGVGVGVMPPDSTIVNVAFLTEVRISFDVTLCTTLLSVVRS